MKIPAGSATVAIVLLFVVLSATSSPAIENKHTEDFTTTQYKDALNTTADWDTTAGELSLFPFALTLVGTYDTQGKVEDITVSGDYAFVVAVGLGFGLHVIDISDPTNCDSLGSYLGLSMPLAVTVAGDYAFVATHAFGLHVIDISDPAIPTLLGAYDTPGRPYDVTVAGDYAFVADGPSGLQVIDISDPTNPDSVGTYNTPGSAQCVSVSGDHAFVADLNSGLQVIDISDPTSPTGVGSYNTPSSESWDVTVAGDYAFVTDGGGRGLLVIDILNPANPALLGSCYLPGNYSGVTVSGDYAYVANLNYGLQVIDIADPANPALLGSYDTPGYPSGITVSGDYAFVADGYSGFQVIDVAEFVNPTLKGAYATPGEPRGVTVSGDYAFVGDGTSGLQIIDISDPTTPTILGTYDTPGYARVVTVSGDYAFVPDYDAGLQVIDISAPTNPTLLGSYHTPDFAYGVTVAGDHAFVADGASGLLIIDISDPTNPALLGTYNTSGTALDVIVAGDEAYVADYDAGLKVIDISDPTTPTILGTYNTPGIAVCVTVAGDCAFVAASGSGLVIIDISDSTNPTLLGTYETPRFAWGVTVAGDYAFVADGYSGLQVIDIVDPTTPTLLGSYITPDQALGVTVSGDYAFVTANNSGLQVIQVFQREFNLDDNVGQSLFVDASSDSIFRARLTTTQTDSLDWELSADSGANWQEVSPGASWNRMNVPGTDLLWRSTLSWISPGDNPGATGLQIEWLISAAAIQSIIDVPDDQGGWVRAFFTRSAWDFPDEVTEPILHYGIWQRIDSPALIAAVGSVSSMPTKESATGDTPYLSGILSVFYGDRTYVQSGPGLAASSFPPGTWELVLTVPAVQQDTYIAAVPTAADSSASGTNHTVFVMTAHTTTPSIWYVSAPDSGYSLDNIAPAVPTSFAVVYNTGSGNQLSWDPCPDEDFQHFNIYRSSDPNFAPSPSELVHSATGTNWSDPEYDGWDVFYKVTALDFVENESDPAGAGTVTAVTEPVIPQTYGLYANVPNPFNPTTVIRYDVPAGDGVVTLQIYNVSGALIRTLADGPQTAGQKTATWNGRDDRGHNVASGVYFYRLQAPGYEKTRKMVLVQ